MSPRLFWPHPPTPLPPFQSLTSLSPYHCPHINHCPPHHTQPLSTSHNTAPSSLPAICGSLPCCYIPAVSTTPRVSMKAGRDPRGPKVVQKGSLMAYQVLGSWGAKVARRGGVPAARKYMRWWLGYMDKGTPASLISPARGPHAFQNSGSPIHSTRGPLTSTQVQTQALT